MKLAYPARLLWFDVESRYEATRPRRGNECAVLWFDVESRYEATRPSLPVYTVQLWFDVESRYEATFQYVNGCMS